MLTAENVREVFDYAEDHGGLLWRRRPGAPKNWNSRWAGERAGCVNQYGYRQLTYSKRNYLEHRVVWLWHHGVWPSQVVDHVNRDQLDNRIENLRDVSHSVNRRNVSAVYVRPNRTGTWTLSYTFDNEAQARAALDYCQNIGRNVA